MANGLSRKLNINIPESRTNIIDDIFGTSSDRLKRAELKAKENLAMARLEQQSKREDYKLYMQYESKFKYLSDKLKIAETIGLPVISDAIKEAYDMAEVDRHEDIVKDLATIKYNDGEGMKELAELYFQITTDSYYYDMATKTANKTLNSFGDVLFTPQERISHQMNTTNLYSMSQNSIKIRQVLDSKRANLSDEGGNLNTMTEEELMKVDVGDPLAEGAMTTYGQLQEKYENNLAAMEETQLLIDKHNNKARNKLQYVMDTYGPKLDPEATPEDLDYRLPSDIAGILEGIDTFGLETPDIDLSSLPVDTPSTIVGDNDSREGIKEIAKLEISAIEQYPEAVEHLQNIGDLLESGPTLSSEGKRLPHMALEKEVDKLVTFLKNKDTSMQTGAFGETGKLGVGYTDVENLQIIKLLEDLKSPAQGLDYTFDTFNEDRLKAEGFRSRKHFERKLARQQGEETGPFDFQLAPKLRGPKIDRLKRYLAKEDAITIQDLLEVLGD